MLIGLVGKPSAGKSTFFKACTLAEVDIANYPFTTIAPNHGIGYVKVRDPAIDFGKRSNPREGFVLGEYRFVPVQMIDVAGLVPEAHLGKGRGNQFLDDLRQADVLIHIVDMSGSLNAFGEPVAVGSYDPAEDVKFLETELDMWYLGILKKGWEKFARTVMQEKGNVAKALGKQLSGLGVDEDMVKEAVEKLKLSLNPIDWKDDDLKNIAVALRKKTKPMVIAANKLDVPVSISNFERVSSQFPDYVFVKCSGESELALREAAKKGLIGYIPGSNDFAVKGETTEQQKKGLDFIKQNVLGKLNTTGVQEVMNIAVFDLLKYVAIFPGGVNKLEDSKGNCLPDCFLMKPGTTALDFAFRLHTDFGKTFIRAIDVRTKMTVGKEYKLKNMDIMEIVSGK